MSDWHMPGDPFYTISDDQKSITCYICGKTSHNVNDVKHRYCPNCHAFFEDGPLPEN